MPIAFSIDRSTDVLSSELSEPLTLADIELARSKVVETEGWSPSMRHLIDLRGLVLATGLGKPEMTALAGLRSLFAPGVLQVVVAEPDSVAFGLVRTFQTVDSSERNVHLVDSIEKARALLGC